MDSRFKVQVQHHFAHVGTFNLKKALTALRPTSGSVYGAVGDLHFEIFAPILASKSSWRLSRLVADGIVSLKQQHLQKEEGEVLPLSQLLSSLASRKLEHCRRLLLGSGARWHAVSVCRTWRHCCAATRQREGVGSH